ncbi:MAG: hypothetical protein J7518_04400 [Nocardioidaceae bacterium]|nr:hypothetical protein [Nocardioidaceae bacterium]
MTSREDEAWRSIVEHFGDRAELSADEIAATAPPEPEPEPEQAPVLEIPAELAPSYDEEHYVPPPAPPVPVPHGARLAAWIGLFGVPAVALLTVVAGISLPSYAGLLLFCWFVAGFGYLVMTMNDRRGDRDDGWDDGAVL